MEFCYSFYTIQECGAVKRYDYDLEIDYEGKRLLVRRDADFATGMIGDVKTKAALREIPIPDLLLVKLKTIRRTDDKFVLDLRVQQHIGDYQPNIRRLK